MTLRAYDVGLSDDAGGGNPLGFAMKVGHAPVQAEVTRLDDYIKWTLYGVKPDTALPPLKSLQIRYGEPGMEGAADGIRMTMYYYNNASAPSANWSGHFAYDYKMQDHCGLDGIEGGANLDGKVSLREWLIAQHATFLKSEPGCKTALKAIEKGASARAKLSSPERLRVC